jgi:uncharacterized protein YwgA
MDPRDAVMLTIRQEEKGTLHGRTLLQKKLYFASVLAGEDFDFRPHYYGPYSQTVAAAVDSVVSNGFLKESIESFPGEANLFGERERRRHSYSLTEDGEAVVKAMPGTDESAKWREALQRVNSHDVAQNFNLLSVAAKVHVILKELGKARTSEISRQAERYGWKLPQHDIEKVGEYLEHLDLITRKVPGE